MMMDGGMVQPGQMHHAPPPPPHHLQQPMMSQFNQPHQQAWMGPPQQQQQQQQQPQQFNQVRNQMGPGGIQPQQFANPNMHSQQQHQQAQPHFQHQMHPQHISQPGMSHGVIGHPQQAPPPPIPQQAHQQMPMHHGMPPQAPMAQAAQQTSGPNLPLLMQPEFRIYEMNKRLAYRVDHKINEIGWWEGFTNEFFDDNAKLTIRNLSDENNQSRSYTIGRTLIPRFFRSFGEGGAHELYFHINPIQTGLKYSKDQMIFDANNANIVTNHGEPMFAKICTKGHLRLEFVITNTTVRIREWMFFISDHQELIPRSAIAIQNNPESIDNLSRNITKNGIPQSTVHYLKLCSVLEPMQELMLKSKLTNASPRECLKLSVAQRGGNNLTSFQRSNSQLGTVDGNSSQSPTSSQPNTPTKRRKRKASGETKKETKPTKKAAAAAAAAALAGAASVASSAGQPILNQVPQPHLMNQTMMGGGMVMGPNGGVMVVGEPSLMGGDFGEEDERLITRLENNQYDTQQSQQQIKQQTSPFPNRQVITSNSFHSSLQDEIKLSPSSNQHHDLLNRQLLNQDVSAIQLNSANTLNDPTSPQQQQQQPVQLQMPHSPSLNSFTDNSNNNNNNNNISSNQQPSTSSSSIASSSQSITSPFSTSLINTNGLSTNNSTNTNMLVVNSSGNVTPNSLTTNNGSIMATSPPPPSTTPSNKQDINGPATTPTSQQQQQSIFLSNY